MLGKFNTIPCSVQLVSIKLIAICVRHIWEAMRHVWPDAHWPGEQHLAAIESRL